MLHLHHSFHTTIIRASKHNHTLVRAKLSHLDTQPVVAMASSRRHTRGAKIYYAESTESSDGDHSDSLYTSHAQDSATSTTQRTRRSMHQLNSTRPQRRGAPALRSQAHIEPRAKRSSHRQSYNDSTSSETSDEDIVLRTAKRRKAKPSVATHSPYPRKLKQSLRNHNVAVRTPPRPIESDGKNPVWQRLPYEVLLSIFRYSIHPLHGEDLKQTLSVNWAVQAARICKAFSEPVLTALYESPPLHFLDQPFGLLNLLKVPGPKMIDYQVKIKSLQMAAKQTLAYSAPGRGLFAITDLLAALPQLQDLDISGPRDRPPFFTTTNHGAWNYPQDMFTVMSSVGMKLKRFHLNGDMLQSADGKLAVSYCGPYILSLQRISLSLLLTLVKYFVNCHFQLCRFGMTRVMPTSFPMGLLVRCPNRSSSLNYSVGSLLSVRSALP